MTSGRKILITGATSGLGEFLAGKLSQSNELLVVGRNGERINQKFPDASCYETDLSLIEDVKRTADRIAAEHRVIDLVICNAGMLGREKFTVTSRNIEETICVNYLSHYILLSKIWPSLMAGTSKIIMIGSAAASWYTIDFSDPQSTNDYRPLRAYGRTKAMLMMLGKWLHNHPAAFPDVYVVDPGTFRSGIARSRAKWFQRLYRTAQWAMTPVDKAASDILDIINGKRFSPGKLIRKGKEQDLSFSIEEISKLMHMSTELTGCEINPESP